MLVRVTFVFISVIIWDLVFRISACNTCLAHHCCFLSGRCLTHMCITFAGGVKKIIPGCCCNPCDLLCTLSNQRDKPFNYLDLFVLFFFLSQRALLSPARLHLVPFSHFRGFLRGAPALIWYLDFIRSSRIAADAHGRADTRGRALRQPHILSYFPRVLPRREAPELVRKPFYINVRTRDSKVRRPICILIRTWAEVRCKGVTRVVYVALSV